MKFTCFQIADVSTKHITAGDGKLIGVSAPGHIASVDPLGDTDESPGDIFSIPSDVGNFRILFQEMSEHGFSDEFLDLIMEIHKQGIPYVRFDRDGMDVEGAPEFDW